MSYAFALLFGAVGAVIGWAAAVHLIGSPSPLDLATRWPFLPSGPGPIGSAVGALIAAVAAFYLRGRPKRFWPAALRGTALMFAFAVLAVGALRAKQGALDYFAINYPEPTLHFEIRLPAQAVAQRHRNDIQVALFTDRNQSLATLADGWLQRERDYLVLRGEVSLYIRTVERDLVLTIPGGPDRIFQLRLPQNPASSEGFGAWRSVDVIGEPEGARRPPGPDDDFEIRYRVERND